MEISSQVSNPYRGFIIPAISAIVHQYNSTDGRDYHNGSNYSCDQGLAELHIITTVVYELMI